MSVVRAFIAIELPGEIQQHLDQVAAQLKQRLNGLPVRWVPANNMHLTLKFLGDVSVANLEILKEVLLSEAAQVTTFEVSVGGIGAFPNAQRPRVVWIGVEAPPELEALQSSLENRLARLGYSREDRPFSPHLTLARVSRSASSSDIRQIGGAVQASKVGFLGATCVQEIRLYKSDLQPGGSVYTCLFSARLAP